MRVVFMGTPDFSVACLTALIEGGHTVPLVVTQPDRPKGRGRQLAPTPVKAAALDRQLEVFQPERPNHEEAVATIVAARPDVVVVVAYGAILKASLLGLAPRGAVNVHASLLPRHRGMSPIHRAILDGDKETGVTTMYMDEGVDTGDMILMQRTDIGANETTGQLHDRLAELGARLLLDTLAQIEAGTAPRRPQPAMGATYAGRIDKAHGAIDWSRPADEVHDHIRGMTPAPGATSVLEGEALLLSGSRPVDANEIPAGASVMPGTFFNRSTFGAPPGTILAVLPEGFRVATGNAAIDIHQVRPPGGRTMTGAEYARGRDIGPGRRFNAPAPAATSRTPEARR